MEVQRNLANAQFYLAAGLANLGRYDEARHAVTAGPAANPNYSITVFRSAIVGENPTYLAGRDRIIDGMRKARVPKALQWLEIYQPFEDFLVLQVFWPCPYSI